MTATRPGRSDSDSDAGVADAVSVRAAVRRSGRKFKACKGQGQGQGRRGRQGRRQGQTSIYPAWSSTVRGQAHARGRNAAAPVNYAEDNGDSGDENGFIELDEDGDPIFEVDEIVGEQGEGDDLQYLVYMYWSPRNIWPDPTWQHLVYLLHRV